MLGKRAIDLRVSTIPAKNNEKVVMRVIDNRGSAVTLAVKPAISTRSKAIHDKEVSVRNRVVRAANPRVCHRLQSKAGAARSRQIVPNGIQREWKRIVLLCFSGSRR